jgi:hypothetical protein
MPAKAKKNFFSLISDIIKDPDRKSLRKIISETAFLTFYHRRSPRFYFSRYLFKKERQNIKDYFPDSFLEGIKPYFNDQDSRIILEDKLFFGLYFNQFDISLPKILMHNYGESFFLNKEEIKISSPGDFARLLKILTDKYLNGGSVFVKKTSWSYGGDKIFKISSDQLNDDLTAINQVYSEVITSGYIFQETIKQNAEMDSLNPSCLNTIRMDTFTDRQGKAEIISAYLRTSVENLVVDNISQGGCMLPIDIETGQLRKKGFGTLKRFGVTLPERHPVTHKVFEGFKIPYFHEVKELAVKAAAFTPCLRLVGWDIGIGEGGPVLIEGNSNYDSTGNDLASGGFGTCPVFRKVLEEYRIRSKR